MLSGYWLRIATLIVKALQQGVYVCTYHNHLKIGILTCFIFLTFDNCIEKAIHVCKSAS